MRNRRFIGAFLLAVVMSAGARTLSADAGAPGGPQRSTCAFLQGILMKVGSPETLGAIFERIFECDLDY
jgi:hypothetical protein